MNLCALKGVSDRLTVNYITDIHKSQQRITPESQFISQKFTENHREFTEIHPVSH
jgi:hypothetical protein